MLVNDVWGAERLIEWNVPVWEHSLEGGLRMLRLAIDTHIITSHFALPLLIKNEGGLVVEMTDGTAEYNAEELQGVAVLRPGEDLRDPLGVGPGPGACAPRVHGGRPDPRLAALGDDAGQLRGGGVELARGDSPCSRTSPSPRRRATWAGPWPTSPRTRRSARWNGRSLSSGALAKEYGFTDLDGSRPDAWRYLVEVQDAGLPADTTGYR